MPKRIQRKRTKGWKMPEGAVYVGRPTTWGNSHVVFVDVSTHQQAVDLYKRDIQEWRSNVGEEKYRKWLAPLKGKDLVCWCGEEWVCHADFLLEIANA